MEIYFGKQLRLISSVQQLVQYIEIDCEWNEKMSLPENAVTKITVHPFYEELSNMEYCGISEHIPVFKLIQKESI